jgi:hypothetical protein
MYLPLHRDSAALYGWDVEEIAENWAKISFCQFPASL